MSAYGAGIYGAGVYGEGVTEVVPEVAAELGGTGTFTATRVVVGVVSREGTIAGAGAFSATRVLVEVVYRTGVVAGSGTFAAYASTPRQASPGTIRWTLVDTRTDEAWTMPINPDSMSSPLPRRSLKYAGGYRKDQRVRAFSGPSGPIEWEFGGVIRSKSHYDRLTQWAEKSVAVDITDHLGRTFRVFISEFNPTDRRSTPRAPWRLRYTMKALILERVG